MKTAARLTLVLAALVLAALPSRSPPTRRRPSAPGCHRVTPNGDMPSVITIKQVEAH